MSSSSAPVNIRIGPSGWNFPQWDGLVYPSEVGRDLHPLEFLAERFDVVEVPTTFSHFLQPQVTRLWRRVTSHNPDFRFTAKLHRKFVYDRQLEPSAVSQYNQALDPLLEEGKLGCVLLQFPTAFRFTSENRKFLIELRRAFSNFPLVAELRHRSWANQEGLGTLMDYHIGYCNVDQPETVRSAPPSAHLTWRIGYAKLHGRSCGMAFDRDEEGSERFSGNDYLYGQEELAVWVQRIQHFSQCAAETYVIFNNDAGGKSVVNALQMQALMGSKYASVPKTLARTYRNTWAGLSQQELFPAPGRLNAA